MLIRAVLVWMAAGLLLAALALAWWGWRHVGLAVLQLGPGAC